MKNISTDKAVIIVIGVFVIIFFGVIVVNASKEGSTNQSETPAYSTTDDNRPVASVDNNFQDLNTMKVSDEKTGTFTITNNGASALLLSDISSSCGCTFGVISINGTKSPEFGMHSNSNWQGIVEPNNTATVDVVYKPSIMPVKGSIDREVYITTNDPNNPLLTFTVRAFVE